MRENCQKNIKQTCNATQVEAGMFSWTGQFQNKFYGVGWRKPYERDNKNRIKVKTNKIWIETTWCDLSLMTKTKLKHQLYYL